MTWRRTGSFLTVMVVVLGIAGCNESVTGPKEEGRFGIGNSGSFVTTGGASNEITFIVDLFSNRMSFNAKGFPASGQFNFQGVISGVNSHVQGDVTCYTISGDGKTARVGGVTRNSDVFEPGTEVMWTVRDNGEGSTGTADEVTNLRLGGLVTAQAYCDLGLSFVEVMFPIETGNVQVHP